MPEVLRGDLRCIGMPSVLQLAEAEAVTGRLTLPGVGVVSLYKGAPVGAAAGELEGLRALLELFVLPVETFRLDLEPDVRGEPLGALVGLIMEGCRLADEWNRLAPLPLAEAAPGVRDGTPEPAARVVAHLEREPSVERAVLRAKVARSAVIDPLLDLLDRGALRERTRPPAPPRVEAPPPADYYAAVERGRDHLRAGRFDEAEAAFRAALAARPGDRVTQQNLRRVRQVREGTDTGLLRWFRARR